VEWIKKRHFSLRGGSAQKVTGHANTNNVDINSPANFNGHSTERDRNSEASCNHIMQ
jgi:hypothetical protein